MTGNYIKKFNILLILNNLRLIHGLTSIRICQNKHCVRNYPRKYDGGLIQTIQDLIPSPSSTLQEISIESSGCLSQCNQGPNISINDRVFHKVNDVSMVAAILDVGLGIDSPGFIMAAIENMANACKSRNSEKKIEILTGVIQSLQDSNGMDSIPHSPSNTTVMAHALILRAEARLEMVPHLDENLDLALSDALRASEINHTDGRIWRVVADVKEAKRDIVGAILAIKQWSNCNPNFSKKALKELERLSTIQNDS